MSMTYRQQSTTGRTCCICDRPCAILDCQCLENFQQNTSEHGNLMKRLTAAFSMPVSAKDLHSFSLCCSCEHHLVVIEQANRIKECIKQVFIETREHRRFISDHMIKHGKAPSLALSNRAKRLSSAFTDSRSFDEASPRVKRSRVSNSSSLPVALPHNDPPKLLAPTKTRAGSTSKLSVSEDKNFSTANKFDITMSFDSVFLPPVAAPPSLQPPGYAPQTSTIDHSCHDTANTDNTKMELEEPNHDTTQPSTHLPS